MERNLLDRMAQPLLMIEVDRRDDDAMRMIDHVGRVEVTPEPHFEQQIVGRCIGKQPQGGARRDLELRDGLAGIDAFDILQRVIDAPRADELAGKPDAFVYIRMRAESEVDDAR